MTVSDTMMRLSIVVLLANAVSAQEDLWREKKCGSHKKIAKHSHPPVCILTNVNKKAVFYPEVDEYSVLDVKDITYANTSEVLSEYGAKLERTGQESNETEIRIAVRVGNMVTYPKSFNIRDGDTWIIPFFTAVIHLTNGEPDGAFWDDGCLTCDDTTSECLRDHANKKKSSYPAPDAYQNADKTLSLTQYSKGMDCGHTIQTCQETAGLCGPVRVYLAWQGTDKNGEPLTSAGSVISRFRSFSIKGVLNAAGSNFNKLKDVANSV